MADTEMKKLIILVGLFMFIAVLLIAFTLFGRDSSPSETTPTPTISRMDEIRLVNSTPPDSTLNVPRDQEIVLTFSESVDDDDITILVGPNTGHGVLFRGKTVVVRPVPLWDEGTPYRITIQYADLSIVPEGVNFTVAGKTPETLPDTKPNPTQIKVSEDLQLNARPDIYLSNYTPYETTLFTISSEFKATPTGHFAFFVDVKDNAAEFVVEDEVRAWAESHGITDEQFKILDISFR